MVRSSSKEKIRFILITDQTRHEDNRIKTHKTLSQFDGH